MDKAQLPRVLLVSQYFPYLDNDILITRGGIERYSFDLAKKLSSLGYGVQVLAQSLKGIYPSEIRSRKTKDFYVFRYSVPNPRGLIWLLLEDFYAFLFTLIYTIKLTPDIVHVIGGGYHMAFGVVIASKFLRKPCLFTVCMAPDYHFTRKHGKKATIDRLLAFTLLDLCNQIITPSEEAAKFIRKDCPSAKIKVIPHWVSETFLVEKPIDAKDVKKKWNIPDGPIVLFVGRISIRDKRVDLVVKAFKRVKDHVRNANLVLVGGSWGKYDGDYQEIRNLVEKSKVQDVFMTGQLNSEELIWMYRVSTVFVLPSQHESQGLVVLEALNAGLPVVLSDLGCFREMITNGKEGFIVRREPETLAEALLTLLEKSDLREKMSRAAKEGAKRFSSTRIIPQILIEYHRLIKQGKCYDKEEILDVGCGLRKDGTINIDSS